MKDRIQKKPSLIKSIYKLQLNDIIMLGKFKSKSFLFSGKNINTLFSFIMPNIEDSYSTTNNIIFVLIDDV